MSAESSGSETGAQRIDKWLWFTRVLKTRSLASRLVLSGKVRVNGERIAKPGKTVGEGDVLTFTFNDQVRVLKVVSPGRRRGPYEEARLLYQDLRPQPPARGSGQTPAGKPAARPKGAGRPTKKQRRDIEGWLAQED